MTKIFIDYSVKGTVEVEMDERGLSYLKDTLQNYKEDGFSKNLAIEERFADEISQHIKYMATVEIEDWEIQE